MNPFFQEFRAGWRNLVAATIGIGLGVPCYTPVSSLFSRALGVEFGWSATVAVGALVALPITALALPFAGQLIDRFGVRITTAFSTLALAVGFLWLSRMNGSATEYYAAFIALNVLGCATGPIGYTVLVAAQFKEARGSALACAQFGIAALAVLLPPIIGSVMTSYGWRGAYLLLAGAVLAGGIVAQLLMHPPKPEANGTGAAAQTGEGARKALKTPAFWILGTAILAISVGSIGFVSQLQSVLIERGSSAVAATWMISLLAVSVMISRLAVGYVLDLSRPGRSAAIVMLLAAAGAAMLLPSTGTGATAFAILLFGISIGAELDLLAFFCARLFGTRHYAAVYGFLAMFFYIGIALGGIGYGAIRDLTGSYQSALLMTVASLFMAAMLFLILERDRRLTEARDKGALHAAA
jgi:predicted MFS family arabinose efflux permease